MTAFPTLTNLPALEVLDFADNRLTVFPTLTGFPKLDRIYLNGNQIHGAPPQPPQTLLSSSIHSLLCPNPMDLPSSVNDPIEALWDVATGAGFSNHWWDLDGPGTGCDHIFTSGFEAPL